MKIKIDPFKETMLSMSKAARIIPGGPKTPQTVYRWHSISINGVKLDAVLIGGRLQTSKEALGRFFAAVTAAQQQSDGEDAAERPDHVQSKLEAAGLV